MSIVKELISGMTAFEIGYDVFIIAFAMYIFWGLAKIYKGMKETDEKTEAAYKKTLKETMVDKSGNLKTISSTELDKEKHEPIRKEFNKQSVEYTKFVSLISILPLLGLLGTVLGLMPGLSAAKSGNTDELYASLSTALTSTFTGLLGTILLKLYVSTKPEKIANRIEILFEEIDRRTDNALELRKIDKSQE